MHDDMPMEMPLPRPWRRGGPRPARRAMHPHPTAPARGAALVDALIAFVVLSSAAMATARLQPVLHRQAELARQRVENLRVGEAEIERLRAYASLPSPSATAATATPAWDSVTDGSLAVAADAAVGRNVDAVLTRSIAEAGEHGARYKTATVRVGWQDRAAVPQEIRLDTVIAAADPALAVALVVAAAAPSLLPQAGRAPGVPWSALRLGDGTSAWRLAGDTPQVLRLDDGSGQITAVCADGGSGSSTAGTAAAPTGCTPAHGLLLSGSVRYDDAPAPDPVRAHAAALPVGLQVSLTEGGSTGRPPTCAVTLPPAGASEQTATYTCAIYADAAPPRWSGRAALLPVGWQIGTAAGQHRVCRYSADQDGSGAIDSNAEHPAAYRDVTADLAQQNYLVIRGDAACPSASAGAAAWATLQHQP